MIIGNHNLNYNSDTENKDNDFEEINQEISKALTDMKEENINKNNENNSSLNLLDSEEINNSYNSDISNLSLSNKSSPHLNYKNNYFNLGYNINNNMLNNSFNFYNSNKNLNNLSISFQLDYLNNSFTVPSYSPNFMFLNNNNNINNNIKQYFENDFGKLNYNNNNNNNKNIECLDSPKNIIHLDNVLKLKDKRTTIMIRHIPNRYNLNLLMNEINKKFSEKYDVLYLPLDITNNSNLGFGFINFKNSIHILYFCSEFNNKKWNHFNSGKRCQIVYSKTQGKKELIKYIQRKNGINIFSNNNSCKYNCFYIQNDSLDLRGDIEIPINYYNVFKNYYPYSLCHKKDESTFIVDKYYNF